MPHLSPMLWGLTVVMFLFIFLMIMSMIWWTQFIEFKVYVSSVSAVKKKWLW